MTRINAKCTILYTVFNEMGATRRHEISIYLFIQHLLNTDCIPSLELSDRNTGFII